MLIPTPPDRLEQIQAALRDRQSEPEVRNLSAVLSLAGETLEFPAASGHFYIVKPTPYVVGLRLQALMRDFRELKDRKSADPDTLREMERCQAQALFWFKRLARPVNPVRRVLYCLPWVNPFRACTDTDIAQLLVFFYALTTKSSVRFSIQEPSRVP